jgi:hypothetical protein
MSSREPARAAARGAPAVLLAVVAVAVALVAILGHHPLASSVSVGSGAASRAEHHVPSDASPPHPGVTVFDDRVPAVANLDPALLAALRRAADDSADDGVRLVVNSGWRSASHQEQLLRAAVAEYGSEAEAARWVATPKTSPHVSGHAVDVGPPAAAAWLSEHGSEYGLCQIYDNEPWHYELRRDAVAHGCPRRYADPTHDPRMQQ